MELMDHETNSQHRYEKLHSAIKEVNKMSDAPHIKNVFEPVNPFGMGMGYGGAGLGAGAGGLAGIAGGVLGGVLTRGGLFGNEGRGEGVVTPSQLTAALAGVQDTQMNTAVLQGLGDIKAAVPLAESQVQLALAQAQGQVSNQIGQQSLAIAQGFASQAQNTAQAQAAIIAVGESVKDSVNANGTANLLATQTASSQNLAAIANSTNLILTALKDGEIASLQRALTVAELRNTEDRAEARARGTEVNVSQTVTQNQNNLQAQAQMQNQFQILAQLAAGVNNLANDIQAVRQTQSQVVFGNNIGSGQAANATNNSVR